MIQDLKDLEKWYSKYDPWEYEGNSEDKKRKEILLSEIPQKKYQNVLDIGCGHGFITRDLPGKRITGVDISKKAILQANKKNKNKRINYVEASIYELTEKLNLRQKFDLIILTGVLYPQYIGKSSTLIYLIIDQLLKEGGVLASVHINDWYSSKFPYLMLNQYFYDYKDYTHRLEVYIK